VQKHATGRRLVQRPDSLSNQLIASPFDTHDLPIVGPHFERTVVPYRFNRFQFGRIFNIAAKTGDDVDHQRVPNGPPSGSEEID